MVPVGFAFKKIFVDARSRNIDKIDTGGHQRHFWDATLCESVTEPVCLNGALASTVWA
jgi:hypothetical protein